MPYMKRKSYRKRPRVSRPMSYRRSSKRPRLNVRSGGLLGIERKYADMGVRQLISDDIEMESTASGGNGGFAIIGATTASNASTHSPAGTTYGGFGAIAQGSDANSRDGRKCTLRSISITGQIEHDSAHESEVILALVQDKQHNAAASLADTKLIFTNVQSTLTSPDTRGVAHPVRNLEYMSRFNVLKFKRIRMDHPAVASSKTVKPFSLSWNGAIRIDYTAGSTTEKTAAVQTNNTVFLVAFSSGPGDTLVANCRTRFYG